MGSDLWLSADQEIGLHSYTYGASEFEFPPHTHSEYTLTFCLDRRMEVAVRGRSYLLDSGDLLVINPGDLHSPTFGGAAAFGLAVTPKVLRAILGQMNVASHLLEGEVFFPDKMHDPYSLRLVRELVTELERREDGYQIVLASLVQQIMVYLLRNALRPAIRPPSSLDRQLPCWQMMRAFEYMNSHGKSAFNETELCTQIGSSPSRFIRLFQNSSRTSPHLCHDQILIQKGKNLLLAGCSIKEVAYELGFLNESHFCRTFRIVAGMTANTFRLLPSCTQSLLPGP
jgi:AraC-like DNA-binding protein